MTIIEDWLWKIVTMSKKFLSFCTTCMNRLFHLKETLPYNLERLNEDEEICLINYNSQDGLDEFIKENYMHEIEAGRLRYFHTTEPDEFHASISKNLAVRASFGEYVFNLDADNYICDKTRENLNGCIEEHGDKFAMWEYYIKENSTCGRISCHRSAFDAVGGYDENLRQMGYQDLDLLNCLQRNGYVRVKKAKITRYPIKHSKDEKIKNVNTDVSWWKLNKRNRRQCKKKYGRGIITNNPDGQRKFKGILNFKEEIEI